MHVKVEQIHGYLFLCNTKSNNKEEVSGEVSEMGMSENNMDMLRKHMATTSPDISVLGSKKKRH